YAVPREHPRLELQPVLLQMMTAIKFGCVRLLACHSDTQWRNPYCFESVCRATHEALKMIGIRHHCAPWNDNARVRQWLAMLFVLGCLFPLSAGAQQKNPQEGTTAGNYNIRQSSELGYRVTSQTGNRSVFDSIVDEHTGLRLVDQSLEVHSVNNAGLL